MNLFFPITHSSPLLGGGSIGESSKADFELDISTWFYLVEVHTLKRKLTQLYLKFIRVYVGKKRNNKLVCMEYLSQSEVNSLCVPPVLNLAI